MIEGIKVRLSSAELVAHLEKRAEHHRQRIVFYTDQIASLKAGGITSYAITGDPIAGLEHSRKNHIQRVNYFSILAEHIAPDETYLISEYDLEKIEMFAMQE